MKALKFGRAKGYFLALFLAFGLFASSAAQAQIIPPPPSMAAALQTLFSIKEPAPDVMSVPALSNLIKGGASLYHLGQRSDMHGWLIVQDGRIQMIYLSPDKQTVLIGGMFSSQGDNVTSPQVESLLDRNGEVRAIFEGPSNQAQAQQPLPSSQPSAQPPQENLSPGERLMRDIQAASSVTLGGSTKATLYMVVAPSCPNCKSTWKELKDAVTQGRLQVHLIPAYNSEGPNERAMAARLLRVDNPLEAWNRFVDGDNQALVGQAQPQDLEAVDSNMNLISKWNIQGFPYLVYRGRDGQVKIVQGRPQRIGAVLDDLPQ